MSLWSRFWEDEAGAIVSAELIAIGTVAVIGGTAGMNMMGHAVNDELRETAFAIRSFDQSYAVSGYVSGRAWKAGSSYTQQDVKKSLRELEIIGDQPNVPQNQPKKPPKKSKKKFKEQADDVTNEDETAFLQADDAALLPPDPVESDDDASQVETTIEAAPDA